jgi:hypothetical protein
MGRAGGDGKRALEGAAMPMMPIEREREGGRRYADSAQPKIPGVPCGSFRKMASTGVTAAAIVFMSSSFDCAADAGDSPPGYT